MNFSTLTVTALLVAILASWRVTHLFWGEDGPGDVIVRLRRAAGDSVVGKLLDCFNCLSLWVAAPAAWWLGTTWTERGFVWFAISGGAILLQRLTERSSVPPVASWQHVPPDTADEERTNVLLR